VRFDRRWPGSLGAIAKGHDSGERYRDAQADSPEASSAGGSHSQLQTFDHDSSAKSRVQDPLQLMSVQVTL
jgi:hypothetical protein